MSDPGSVEQSVRFKPLDRRTLPDEIRDRLIASIDGGGLAPGQLLPPERTLCTEFNVARTSVREAIQSLVSLRYVERRGNRAYVVERLPSVELDPRKTRVKDLFETRRVIEGPIVELAACRATPEQREEVVAIAAQFRAGMSLDAFRSLDRDFHSAISRACGNPLLTELYGKVLDALFSSEEFGELLYAGHNRREVNVIIERAGQQHQRIAAAMASGDPIASVGATEEHVGYVEERMIRHLV
jgi:DNA-binding FadR family transcriptional regulator